MKNRLFYRSSHIPICLPWNEVALKVIYLFRLITGKILCYLVTVEFRYQRFMKKMWFKGYPVEATVKVKCETSECEKHKIACRSKLDDRIRFTISYQVFLFYWTSATEVARIPRMILYVTSYLFPSCWLWTYALENRACTLPETFFN